MPNHNLLTDSELEYLRNPKEWMEDNNKNYLGTMKNGIKQKFENGLDQIALLNRNRRLWVDESISEVASEFAPLDKETREEIEGLEEIYRKLSRKAVSESVQKRSPSVSIPIVGLSTNILREYGLLLQNDQLPDPIEPRGSTKPEEDTFTQAEKLRTKLSLDTITIDQNTPRLVGNIIEGLLPRINDDLDWSIFEDRLNLHPDQTAITVHLLKEDGEPIEQFTLSVDDSLSIKITEQGEPNWDQLAHVVSFQKSAIAMLDPDNEMTIQKAYYTNGEIQIVPSESYNLLQLPGFGISIVDEFFEEQFWPLDAN